MNAQNGHDGNHGGWRVGPLGSLRVQLLVGVNAVLGVALVAFVVTDYHREFSQRLRQAQVSLAEEAKTLLPSIQRLRDAEPDAIQAHINAVCSRMRDAESPGHHIAVWLGQDFYQAEYHHTSTPALIEALRHAARTAQPTVEVGDKELVVGTDRQAGATVVISEYATNIHDAVRGQILQRLAGIALLAVLVALVINFLLLRIVVRPVGHLVQTVQRIGRGELGAQAGLPASQELAFLAREVNGMSRSLEKADRERRSQLAKAARIQEQLQPHVPRIPGLTVQHFYRPADHVTGDYLDVVALPDGSWLMCVADVTGHGVPAAMAAAMLKTLMLAATETLTDLTALLDFVDRRFQRVLPDDLFATVLLVRWEPTSRGLSYASAGHEPGLWLSAEGQLQRLMATGPPLGVMPEAEWQTQPIPVADGGRLLALTDGIPETCSPEGIPFGRQRVVDILQANPHATSAEVLQQIDRAVAAHRGNQPPEDDVMLLAIEVEPGQASSPPSA